LFLLSKHENNAIIGL